MTASPHAAHTKAVSLPLLLGVLGVVYGDIGTSPLYALRAALLHFSADGIERWEILGILSLIIWALILTVTVKYVTFILRADNKGEGGILALMALAQRVAGSDRSRRIVMLLGITGACLFFGDGVITPAISVLSAMEGLKVISPGLRAADHPAAPSSSWSRCSWCSTAAPTASARIFGPVMALWFGSLGLLGLIEVIREPEVLSAISPHHAITFCAALQAGGLHRLRLGRAVGDGGGGALCRYGPFRPPADPARLDCSSCCRRWR